MRTCGPARPCSESAPVACVGTSQHFTAKVCSVILQTCKAMARLLSAWQCWLGSSRSGTTLALNPRFRRSQPGRAQRCRALTPW